MKKSAVEKSQSSFEAPACRDMSFGAQELAVEASAVEC
jgi:hypothetical protein